MGPKHTPSDWTFWLSLALVVLAILSMFAKIPYVSTYPLWIAVIGYAILVIGCTVKTTLSLQPLVDRLLDLLWLTNSRTEVRVRAAQANTTSANTKAITG